MPIRDPPGSANLQGGLGAMITNLYMRRFPANLILAVLLWSYTAPGFFAVTELDRPACCRHQGPNHQCHCGCACSQSPASKQSPGYRKGTPHCQCLLLGCILHGVVGAEPVRYGSSTPPAAQSRTFDEAAIHLCRDDIGWPARGPPRRT